MKALSIMTDEKMNCRVCGFTQDEAPWGQNGMAPTFNICSCCGVEFGRNDLSLEQVKDIRAEWIESGCPWFSPEEQPETWDLQAQLQQVPRYFK